ncbi:MAG: glycosyltransferase family 2 protein [Phycisphaerae bacterium]
MKPNAKPTISLVVPVYNEAALIERLHSEVTSAIDRVDANWEVIYVDDGSSDESLEMLRVLQERDSRVVVVELSRNWGHQPAISAGLSVAKGDAVVLMDGDLQDPPSVIPDLVAAWQDGARVVVASAVAAWTADCAAALSIVYMLISFHSSDSAQRRHFRLTGSAGGRCDQPLERNQSLPSGYAGVGGVQNQSCLRPGQNVPVVKPNKVSGVCSNTRSMRSSASATNRCASVSPPGWLSRALR